MTMGTKDEILELIRSTVRAISPKAEIFLFGSRARGTNRADSDWDVLVLIDTPTLSPQDKSIDYELWTKGLDYGHEINCVIRTKSQWNDNISLFKHNVTNESFRL